MANKTLANLFSEIVKRSGISLEEKKTIKAAAENTALASIEIDEEEFTSILSNIHNLTTAESVLKPNIEKTLKGTILNGFDAQIEMILGEGLSDDELTAVKGEKVTASKLRKAFELQKSALQKKLGDAKKHGDTNRESILEAEIARLNNEFKLAKDTFETEKQTLIANQKRELFDVKLQQQIMSRADIADDQKNHRYFAENYGRDLKATLEKNGFEIDFETGKLINATTKMPALDKNLNAVDMDWLHKQTITTNGYEKKSIVPPKGTIEVKPDSFGTLAGAVDMIKQQNQKTFS